MDELEPALKELFTGGNEKDTEMDSASGDDDKPGVQPGSAKVKVEPVPEQPATKVKAKKKSRMQLLCDLTTEAPEVPPDAPEVPKKYSGGCPHFTSIVQYFIVQCSHQLFQTSRVFRTR